VLLAGLAVSELLHPPPFRPHHDPALLLNPRCFPLPVAEVLRQLRDMQTAASPAPPAPPPGGRSAPPDPAFLKVDPKRKMEKVGDTIDMAPGAQGASGASCTRPACIPGGWDASR
jgi:hypothetical protein